MHHFDPKMMQSFQLLHFLVQTDHESRRQCRASPVGVEFAELVFEHRPVDLVGQNEQWMLAIQDLVQPGSEQVGLILMLWLLWFHEITSF